MNFDSKKIFHGVAYYPELWPSSEIKKDIANFREFGINVVRMGEFAWSYFEPEMDKFNIGIYDEVIEELGKNGIMTIMCTPTPTPPRWFTYKFPDSLYVDRNMTKANHGSREHVCLNNLDYIERSKIIVEKLARHYGKNPYVIAWQTHNEYNCPPVKECLCDSCAVKWRKWLKKEYGTIEQMNDEWGAGVWSTKYGSFDEVMPPRPTPNGHSASMTTCYSKFGFDTVAEYNDMQVNILKKYTAAPITHNSNRVFQLDQETLFKNLDFVGFDDYSTQDNYWEAVFAEELCRGLKPDVPFWELETASSYSANIHGSAKHHKKGYVKAEAVSTFFAGGKGFSYWLYRQQRAGTEMPHAHLITSWGAKSHSVESVLEVKKAIGELEEFIVSTSPKRAKVAIMYSDVARAFCDSETLNSINYSQDILAIYKSVLRSGAYRDIVYEHSDLTPYKIIFVPFIMHISDQLRNNLLECVNSGATVVIGPYSGWRTRSHSYYTDRAFGTMEQYFGGEVIDVSQFAGQDAQFEVFGVTSELKTIGAVTNSKIGKISNGFFDGKTLISEKSIGKGKIVFLGAKLADEALDAVVSHYIKQQINPYKIQEGIIVFERHDKTDNYLCLINMSETTKNYELERTCFDVISKNKISGKQSLDTNEYRVYKLLDE